MKKKPDDAILKILDTHYLDVLNELNGIPLYRGIPISNFKKKDLIKICTIAMNSAINRRL